MFILLSLSHAAEVKKAPVNYLDQVVLKETVWAPTEKKPLKSCQEGKLIKLLEPSNSYLLGNRISFFHVNEKEQITQELAYPGCDFISSTTYKDNVLANETFKKCGSKKEKFSFENIVFKSEKEFIYTSDSGTCTYKVVK